MVLFIDMTTSLLQEPKPYSADMYHTIMPIPTAPPMSQEVSKTSSTRRQRNRDPDVVLSLDQFVEVLSSHRGSHVSLDAYIDLLPQSLDDGNTEQIKQPGTESVFGLANAVRDYVTPATGYRWSQKKRRDLANGNGTVVTYYCSQLEGEQSKHVQKTSKGPGWRFGIMQRYHCNGWLHITVPSAVFSGVRQRVRVRITHDEAHPPPPTKSEVRDGRGRFVPGRNGEMPGSPSPAQSTSLPSSTDAVQQSASRSTSSSAVEACDQQRTATPSQCSSSSDNYYASSPDSSQTPHVIPLQSSTPDVMFPRELLVTIGQDVDTILNKAYMGVDGERAALFNSLFLQLRQLGETIRAEDRAASNTNGGTGT